MSFSQLLSFASLIHELQHVKRIAMTPPDQDRWENTVEHSYQLVMLAWYLTEMHQLKLDLSKVMKYALVHDLPEAYAGDTYFADEEARKTKGFREREACERMQDEFPEFCELHTLMSDYEAQTDPESRFVYALDKLVDPMNNALNNWEPARQKGMTLEKMSEIKRPKMAHDPLIADYYEELVAYIEKQTFEGA